MPIDRHFWGHYVNLLADIFADANFLATTVTHPSFRRDIMGNFRARKMLRYLASAVPPLSLVLVRLLDLRGINGPRLD